MNEADYRLWRVGTHYGIHIYAVNENGDDSPVCTAMSEEFARIIVREHNDGLKSGLNA
jgi:hypothetical protein